MVVIKKRRRFPAEHWQKYLAQKAVRFTFRTESMRDLSVGTIGKSE
jgi:hypothetical protein